MATYYVSPSGSDSNSGTSGSRWKTFSHAASVAVAGDTVIFGDGTYDNEGRTGASYVVTLAHSGSAGSPITFQAENRRAAILNSGDGTIAGSAYAYINFANSSYIVVDGFILENSNSEGFHNNDAGHHHTIRNCTVRNIAHVTATDTLGRDGLYANAAVHDIVVDSCIFHDIGRSNTEFTTSLDHGLYFKCSNVTITNCIFYNQVCGWDIQLADGANNVLIANNVFASRNPGQNGQIMVWNSHSGITIQNNIFVDPPNYAVTHYTESVSGGSSFDYNLITNGALAYSGSGIAIGNHNLYNKNPLFTNAAARDYTLQAGSPAIDAGTNAGVTTDQTGAARPQASGYDIGAYEYDGVVTTPPVSTGVSASSYLEEFSGSSLPSGWQRGYYFSNTVPSSAVSVSDNALHLTWTRGGVSDISVSSTATYQYGYFEARMKWDAQAGAWPAFWMVPTSANAAHSGEIDVFEGQGSDPTTFYGGVREWQGNAQIWQSSPNNFDLPGVDFSQWHTYGVLWEAGGKFTWYFDGQPIHSITNAPAIFDSESVFLILGMQEGNNWSLGNLAGVSADSLTLDIDHVAVYATPPITTGFPVIASLTASAPHVSPGAAATLSWSVTGADSLSLNNGVGDVTGLTSKSVTVNATTTYRLTATNTAGTVSAEVSVSVGSTTGGSGTGTGTSGGLTTGSAASAGGPPSIGSFTTSDAEIARGDSATLSFSATNGDLAFIAPEPGIVTGSSAVVSPETTTTYVLTVVNDAGHATESVTITVDGESARNIRYHQIRREDREGDGHQFQMSAPDNPAVPNWPTLYDAHGNVMARQPRGNTSVVQLADRAGGFSEGHALVFDRYGNAQDGNGYPVLSGTKGQTALTATGPGQWYGQVPRGTANGSRTKFYLDYTLANPYTILSVNGIGQKPAVDGPGPNPSPDYFISGTQLTMTVPPLPTDWMYIWYFIGDTVGGLPNHGAITGVNLVITSAHSFQSTTDYTSSGDPTVFNTGGGTIYELAWLQGNAGSGSSGFYWLNIAMGWGNGATGWATRTDSGALTPPGSGSFPWAADGYVLSIGFNVINAFVAGGIGQLRIYDAYLMVSYADGTSAKFYPDTCVASADTTPVWDVVDPGNAIDGDMATYATIFANESDVGGSGLNSDPPGLVLTWGDISTY